MTEGERQSGTRDGDDNQSSFNDTADDRNRRQERGSSESTSTSKRKADADGLENSIDEAQRDRGEVF